MLATLDQHQTCSFITIEDDHPWTLPNEEYLTVFKARVLVATSQVLRGIDGPQKITESILQLLSRLAYHQLVATTVADHRAGGHIGIHSVEARFPENILNILGVTVRVGQNPRGDKNKHNSKDASQNPHRSLPHWSPQMYARCTEPVTLLVGRENEQQRGWHEQILPNIIGARTLAVELNGGMTDGFFRRRIVRPIVELLRQGVTPEKMALSLALGVALGVFPILGTTTALCAVVAFIWRLNLPTIQIVNYFVYPLQIALLIPFFRLGEKMFGAPHLPLSASQILAIVHASFWGATRFLWTTIWHAAVAWCLIAPVFVGLAYMLLVPLLHRAVRRTLKEGVTD